MKTYRIASFNLYKFSANTEKELSEVSQIIRENKVDILAIQEIFSKDALDNLLNELNAKGHVRWDGRWDSPNSRSVSAAEGYAFIWNKDCIELSQNRYGKVFEPRIHNQYPHRDGIELIRNPYYGRFVIKENRMTVNHIIKAAQPIHLQVQKEWYVIEQANIDGIVVWQNSIGEIYQTGPRVNCIKISNSLLEYMKGC